MTNKLPNTQYGSFFPRLSAYILDCMILGLPFILILTFFVMPFFFDESLVHLIEKNDYRLFYEIYVNAFYAQLIGVFIWAAMLSAFICSKMQATPGKRIMNLYITDSKGGRVKFLNAILRFSALPMLIFTIQTPERHMIYAKLEELSANPTIISNNEELAAYMLTPISSYTNLLVVILVSIWYLLIVQTRQKTALHDILFDTRVVNGKLNGKI